MGSRHNNLFTVVFGDPARAAAWLRTVLPRRLVRAIDWTSLRPAPEKLVRETLKLDEVDLVFSARFRDGRPIWILLEHKSYPDAGLADQLTRYVVALRATAPEPNAPLPTPVVTVVLLHGKAGRLQVTVPEIWNDPEAGLPEMIDALAPIVPWFADDLRARSERDILESGLDAVVQLPLLCFGFLGNLTPEAGIAALYRWQSQVRAIDHAADPRLARRVMTALKWYCLDLPRSRPSCSRGSSRTCCDDPRTKS